MTRKKLQFVVFCLLFSCKLWAIELIQQQSNSCINCHKKEAKLWGVSDHAQAMALASEKTVFGDFSNVLVQHFDLKARFFKQDDNFWVEIDEDTKNRYQIKYTFGHEPLQQYLVETERGKIQVLPFSWDTRPKQAGGQRWFQFYSEPIPKNDRLHWLQPSHNWNGMCADCHSDGLRRNYLVEQNQFKTTSNEINVGCLSCHDDIKPSHNISLGSSINAKSRLSTDGSWEFSNNVKTARWQGKSRDVSFMETCFACHSLRTPLTDGFSSNIPYLDQFTPELLKQSLYHADGQIKEESYVYGSFQQSKMFQSGVVCSDCHDVHSGKIKKQDNALCLQCHRVEIFDSQKHHGHGVNSQGSLCMNCHMPATKFMGVDNRRDHSFRIPSPQLSKSIGVPNACNSCHKNKSNDWAIEKLKEWNGGLKQESVSLKKYRCLIAGLCQELQDIKLIIEDKSLPSIYKATVISYFPQFKFPKPANFLVPYLQSTAPLIRIAAAQASLVLSDNAKFKYLAPLLSDRYRAVRISAVSQLLNVEIPSNLKSTFNLAFKELVDANNINGWRGEGRSNQAKIHIMRRDLLKAEAAYYSAIEVDPFFEVPYVNLADIYRQTNQGEKALKLYLLALENIPDSATVRYSYGLFFIRKKEMDSALEQLQKATILAPKNETFIYTYLLALHSSGDKRGAIELLNRYLPLFDESSDLYELKKFFYQSH